MSSKDMKPNLSREVPDTPNQIPRHVDPQPNQINQDYPSRNQGLNLNHRTRPATINPSSITTPNDNKRKRKSYSSGISIPGSSNNNSRCNKKGKNVVQEAGEEGNRWTALRDCKRKGKLELDANNNDVQDLGASTSTSSRPSPAVSTASIPVTAKPTFHPYTLTNITEGTGTCLRPKGMIRSSASFHKGESSSGTRNPTPQPINLTTHTTSRGRSSLALRAEAVPVIDLNEMPSPDSARRAEAIPVIDLNEMPSPDSARRAEAIPVIDLNEMPSPDSAQRAEAIPVIDLNEMPSPDSEAVWQAQDLAHDEMIARQLQEQFNNEMTVSWIMKLDASIDMSLQQEENAMHASAVAPCADRSTEFMASSSLVGNNFAQQMHQEFNQNDYEALLALLQALDEDNHQHAGASTSQINSLPESVVKSGNIEELCTVCLEIPSVGEIIRHLPCLHKFHKDCIDQWLQRKKVCPICRCSIF